MTKWKVMIMAVWMTAVLTACGGGAQGSLNSGQTESAASVAANSDFVQEIVTQRPEAETENPESAQSAEEENAMMEVETEYGTLYYPARWKDALVTAQEKSDETLTVDFSASVEGKEYRLFQVVIGGQEGDSAGILTDDTGNQRNVQLSVEELSGIEELSEEGQNQLYAMQEGVNDLLEHMS